MSAPGPPKQTITNSAVKTGRLFSRRRPESPESVLGAEIKVLAGLCFFLEVLWKNPFLGLFQLLEDTHTPSALKPAMSHGVPLTTHHPDLPVTSSTFKGPVITLGPPG